MKIPTPKTIHEPGDTQAAAGYAYVPQSLKPPKLGLPSQSPKPIQQCNNKVQVNNPQEPGNRTRSNFMTGMAKKKSGWIDEGSLLQKRYY